MGETFWPVVVVGVFFVWIVHVAVDLEVPAFLAKWYREPGNSVRAMTWVGSLFVVLLTLTSPEKSFIGGLRNDAITVAVTVIVIEELGRYRASLEEKERIIRQMGSRSHDFALDALRQIQGEEWDKDGSLCGRIFANANLEGAVLRKAELQRANLEMANLEEAILAGANLQRTNLVGANLQGANLCGAKLQGANLRGAQLGGAILTYASLESADLSGADLEGADLYKADLQKAFLFEANLQNTNLDMANLKEANLMEAKLQNAILTYTNLRYANLMYTNLGGANLQNAYLQGTRLTSYLLGVNLSGAKYDRNTTGLDDIDLQAVGAIEVAVERLHD